MTDTPRPEMAEEEQADQEEVTEAEGLPIDPRIDELVEASELDWEEMRLKMQDPTWVTARGPHGRIERVFPVEAPSIGKVDPIYATHCLILGTHLEATVLSQNTQQERDRYALMMELTARRENQEDELVRDIRKDDPRWHFSDHALRFLSSVQDEMHEKDREARRVALSKAGMHDAEIKKQVESVPMPPIPLKVLVQSLPPEELSCGELRRVFLPPDMLLPCEEEIRGQLRHGAMREDRGTVKVRIRGTSDEPHWRLVGSEGADFEQKDLSILGDADRSVEQMLPWRREGCEDWIQVSAANDDEVLARQEIDRAQTFMAVPRFDHEVGIGFLVVYPDRKSLYPAKWLPPELQAVVGERRGWVHAMVPDGECCHVSRQMLYQLMDGSASQAAVSHVMNCITVRPQWREFVSPYYENMRIISETIEQMRDELTPEALETAEAQIAHAQGQLSNKSMLLMEWMRMTGIDLGVDWAREVDELSINLSRNHMPPLLPSS